jgi:hypothetical protein
MAPNGIMLLSLWLKPPLFGSNIITEHKKQVGRVHRRRDILHFSLIILKDFKLNNTMFRGKVSKMPVATNHASFLLLHIMKHVHSFFDVVTFEYSS